MCSILSHHQVPKSHPASTPRIMGTPQNPGPVQNPLSSPNPDPAPGLKHPSFDEVSKLFSRPLSDAADSLGVCPSVLKKICYDNGLVRWPYRKILSGKTIEEVKKDAAIEKEKQLAKSKVAGERNVALQSSAISSSLSQSNTGSLHESPQTRTITQQPRKDNQIASPPNNLTTIMNKENSATSDEFKYGFPSGGLSSVQHRWWGNKSEIHSVDNNKKDTVKTNQQDSENSAVNLPSIDNEMKECNTDEKDGDYSQWTSSLSYLRKEAAKEGRKALKLGVYRGYGVQMLDQTKKSVLLQIFKSSLPSDWVS